MEVTAAAASDFHRTCPDEAVQALARRSHLAVTTGQLLAAGLSPKAIIGRVRRGWMTRLFRGVYRVGPADVRWTREAGALLACGDAAVLSHATAAAVWGLRPRVDGPIDVTVARGRRAGQAGIRIHHARLTRGEVRRREGLRVTSPERTLHDLARSVGQHDLDRAVNEAEVRGVTTPGALLAYLARSPRPQGVGALREALRQEQVSQSELQRALLGLVRKVGLPPPLTEVMVEGHQVDFLWPDQRVIVETDGFGSHGTRQRFEADRARDAKLTAGGYRVLRFTWRQLTREPEVVAARLAAALAASATPRSRS
jgi:very-short-patch-repair endonuclease